MLNLNATLWPTPATNGAEGPTADAWGLGSFVETQARMFETQARLWNHFLDANRSLWEVYVPWFSAGPSFFTAALPQAETAGGASAEPAPAASGAMADASPLLAAQAQLWNQWLDVGRSVWGTALPGAASAFPLDVTAFGWTLNGTPTKAADGAGDATSPRTPARKSARAGRAR